MAKFHSTINFETDKFTNPNGLAYFNGTACPIIPGQYYDFKRAAREMIKAGLVAGPSLQEQGDLLHAQMEQLEGSIARISKSKEVSDAHLDAWAEEMGEPLTGLLAHWYINVHALLILKRIQNNDDYGMLYFSAKGEPLPSTRSC